MNTVAAIATIAPSPGQLSQSCWWNHLAKNTLLPPDSCPQRVAFLAFLKTTSPWVFRDAASVLIWSKNGRIFQHQTWLIEHQQWIPGIYQQSQGIQEIQSALRWETKKASWNSNRSGSTHRSQRSQHTAFWLLAPGGNGWRIYREYGDNGYKVRPPR